MARPFFTFRGALLVLLLLAISMFIAAHQKALGADETQALMNQALDKQISLSINDVLPQAMQQIMQKTGVRIDVDPVVYDLLPWGQDTNIKATIANQTLREALEGITRKLGLEFDLKDQYILLRPMPGLRRLARRSTVQELGALDKLSTLSLDLNNVRPTLRELLAAIDARLEAAKTPYSIENRTISTVNQETPIPLARNGTLMDALSEIVHQTNATWFPWGQKIVVLSKPDEVHRELNKTVSFRFNGIPLEQVLLELRQRSGIPFEIEPGAIQSIPPESRNIRLVLDNATIQDALESISGFTGLGYTVKDDALYFWNKANGANNPRDSIRVIVHLEDGTDVVMPQSQLPSEVRTYLQQQTQQHIEKLRQKALQAGIKPEPATRPATESANDL